MTAVVEVAVAICLNSLVMSYYSLRKTVNILGCHWWFPPKVTSVRRTQKFHADDMHYPELVRDSDWLEICFTQSEALPKTGLDNIFAGKIPAVL